MIKLVSIITPTFNSAQKIEKCIRSIQNQTYKNIEHIIIDGKSDDNTIDVIKKYKKENIIWVSERDNGITDAMNKGFKMAQGEIFAWIDADNYYELNIVQEIVDIFEADPTIDIIYGNINFVDNLGNINSIHSPPTDITYKKILKKTTGSIPLQPAVFFKKEIFTKVGGFDTQYKVAGDFDFWIRVIKENPKTFYYNKVFGNYLKDESGVSQNIKGLVRGYKEMKKICNQHLQTFSGKIYLLIKYLKGIVKIIFSTKSK